MGYRPGNQALEEPIDKIIEGTVEFQSAVRARMIAGGWKQEHLDEINVAAVSLQEIQSRLYKIKRGTW